MPENLFELPRYSQDLVELVRMYDRAELAVRTSSCLYASLREDDEYYVDGDDSFPDWANVRLNLLAIQLPSMKNVINKLITSESKPWFDCEINENGNLLLPPLISELFTDLPRFHYNPQTLDGTAKAKLYVADNYVLLFEGEGYVVPRAVPEDIIEIWWRRQFYDTFEQFSNQSHYTMALAHNAAYGWDCYGHEL